jgi:hypothetical protein
MCMLAEGASDFLAEGASDFLAKGASDFLAAALNMSYNLGDHFPGEKHGKICH